MPSLEDRIRRLEDRAALQDLVVAYFRATDDDDYDTLAACFTPDAAFVANGFNGADGGRPAIIAFLKSARVGMKQTVHTPNFMQTKFRDDDHASGLVGAHLELGIADKTLFGAVRYLDEYERMAGRWAISRREMRVIHIGPWNDIATSLTTAKNVRWPGADPQPSDFGRKIN